MIAIERHISTKLVLTLNAGQVNGKKTTKRVTVSGLREDVTADEILEVVTALKKLLEHPVDTIRIHTVSSIERASENEDFAETATAGASPAGHAAELALGGVGKNGLLRRLCNDGYLKEPRLPVYRLGNNCALRAPSIAVGSSFDLDNYAGNRYTLSSSSRTAKDGAAIQSETPLVYTRPPPACRKSLSKTGFSLPLSKRRGMK